MGERGDMAVDPIQQTEQRREEIYRSLPSVNEMLLAPELRKLTQAHGHERIVADIRESLAEIRAEIAAGKISANDLELGVGPIAKRVSEKLQRGPEYSLRPVINATGVILHTNLGRAPLTEAALAHLVEVA